MKKLIATAACFSGLISSLIIGNLSPLSASLNAGIAPYSLGGSGSGYTVPFSLISLGVPYYHAWGTNSYQLQVGDQIDSYAFVTNFLTQTNRTYALYTPYINDQGNIRATSDVKYIQTYDPVVSGNSYFIVDFSFSGRNQTDKLVSVKEMFPNVSADSILSYTLPYYAAIVADASSTLQITTNPFSVIAFTANINNGQVSQIFNCFNFDGEAALRPSPLDNYSAAAAKHSISLNVPYNQINNPDDAIFFRLIFNVNGFTTGQRFRFMSFILPVYVSNTTKSEISADLEAQINGIGVKVDETNQRLDDINGTMSQISDILSEDLSGISGSDTGNHYNAPDANNQGSSNIHRVIDGYIDAAGHNVEFYSSALESSQVWLGIIFAGTVVAHLINKFDFIYYLFGLIFVFIIFSSLSGLTRATTAALEDRNDKSNKP